MMINLDGSHRVITMARPAHKKNGIRRLLTVAAVAFLWAVPLQTRAPADDDPLQKAVNYLFTGQIDPQDAPEILDRKSCVVVVADPKFKRYVKYYLGRVGLDTAFINKTYAGPEILYSLDIKSADVIVEYLDLDKTTVLHRQKSAQIFMPGDIDQTNLAMKLIAGRCKTDKPKIQF